MKVSGWRAFSAFFGGAIFAGIFDAFLTLYMPFFEVGSDRMLISALLAIPVWVGVAFYFFMCRTLWKSWAFLALLQVVLMAAILADKS